MNASDREKFNELAKKFGIHFILLFGSKAEGKDTPESDTDIAAYADHVLSEDEKIALTFEISSILKTEKIDLVDLKTAPALLKKKIFDSYKVLFLNDPFLLYQAELSALQQYEESKILYKISDERLKEFIK
ncbi:type VII toxin-antitoxin system MntA family adenylyltransferase antitoxin [Thermodesulfovibrio yellowstonii]|uniref:Nucleotidyltransferase n=1 Tax=Thermodesulfovibrio yellowstonii TaxID=28262 RepID=A0A9W6GFN3_9BACT|nr:MULTISPECIES: nucleotidyltransferase domain-containing protein [Thermodesulfovibrio]MDI6865540.1 nucleotidyltransferase domain-containing protein [Thermodesulfovibrio yellowstonii]GLI53038.1 nucleotidyltransferase [Thermodesulfovibrio islandicus]